MDGKLKSIIQDLFTDCLTSQEVAELYADLLYEIKVNMEDMLNCRKGYAYEENEDE